MSSPFASSYRKNANTSCNKLLQAIAKFQRCCSEHLGWLEIQQLSKFRYQMFVEQLTRIWKTYFFFFFCMNDCQIFGSSRNTRFMKEKKLIRIYQGNLFIKISMVSLKHCDLNLHNHVCMQICVYIIKYIFISKRYSDYTFPG